MPKSKKVKIPLNPVQLGEAETLAQRIMDKVEELMCDEAPLVIRTTNHPDRIIEEAYRIIRKELGK